MPCAHVGFHLTAILCLSSSWPMGLHLTGQQVSYLMPGSNALSQNITAINKCVPICLPFPFFPQPLYLLLQKKGLLRIWMPHASLDASKAIQDLLLECILYNCDVLLQRYMMEFVRVPKYSSQFTDLCVKGVHVFPSTIYILERCTSKYRNSLEN